MTDVRQRQPALPARPAGQRGFAVQVSLIARLLRKRFDERARDMALSNGEALTRAQWRMLGTIHIAEGSTQREIAERLEIGPVAAGQTIDRLEELKWIERRADPRDRRARRLFVTEAAQPVLKRLGLIGDSEDQCAVLGISPADLEKLSALLDDIINNLLAPGPHPAPPGD